MTELQLEMLDNLRMPPKHSVEVKSGTVTIETDDRVLVLEPDGAWSVTIKDKTMERGYGLARLKEVWEALEWFRTE